jgi:hypothetical protein
VIGWLAAGAGLLLLALWALGRYANGDPRRIAELFRKYGRQAAGAALLAISALFAIRGNAVVPMLLAPIGLGLMKTGPWFSGLGATRTPGARSEVKAKFLDMTLDHDTGRLAGVVADGAFKGRELDTMEVPDLRALRTELAVDADSLALFEAYLDRRFPAGREDVHQDPDAGQRRAGPSDPMTDQEAYQILGLQPGAGADEIRAAHRALMKRLHPDQGGSTWLATKVNEAKDILLRKHG